MRLRPYIQSKDFKYIAEWIDNERSHALWCANNFPYPMTMETFHSFLEKTMEEWTVSPFVATDDSGNTIGFFRYSVNTESNEGFLASVIVDNKLRGKGYGREMIQLALRYAFEITGAELVQLNVFIENQDAKRCYESIGFVERCITKNAFAYKDELWSRCNMTITKAINSDLSAR